MFWSLVVEQIGAEHANETIQRLMGNRGPGVDPTKTDWGTSPSAQAAAARLTAVMGPARPIVRPDA